MCGVHGFDGWELLFVCVGAMGTLVMYVMVVRCVEMVVRVVLCCV